ncbi:MULTISPECIES: DUF58 domain-containing protein [unclassified Leptolyngbya]|uniref:DUF58 domain-containing protein n=1 Tax=unclassified Leptolyngbya TaxID=2650499 RepID=UPI0016867781|nr:MULTISPECIES: DUF58 domain-containing protein [unclassified Leptolyngbya]MBD1910946.1 DUF58 domain-containing protein [Leptolyngbya sp. FACHB-8]MBD2158388.1 DUF58 domain-containing protein [Leptolyngbya sp. FACHB-16]
MPAFFVRFQTWLEYRWVAPAYSGWVMLSLAIFFFVAATNTMAGWLYAISGVMLALLTVGVTQPGRSLRSLHITRIPNDPISVGDTLTLELEIHNPRPRPQLLLQVQDLRPRGLGGTHEAAIERIPARGAYHWRQSHVAQQRGLYHWQGVVLRTAAPLGLFWSRRQEQVRASVVVYPTVLPLSRCPLVDELGREASATVQSPIQAQGASEGVTRTLRPYRWGDSTRLIHWRTSARYGELRVRELELFTGGQEVVLGLDSAIAWDAEAFEQAVIAAASLYFYGLRQKLPVSIWTAESGVVRGDRPVLETLAAVMPGQNPRSPLLPGVPIIWMTQKSDRLSNLPTGSRWLLWPQNGQTALPNQTAHGRIIVPDEPLTTQLQASLN